MFLSQAILPSFLIPGLAVAGAAAMAVPIVIHILSKRPRKPEPWAAMKFLLAAYKKHRIRTRMEQWLLLAVRCLMLLLLGLALAGPAWSALGSLTGVQPRGRTVILILDNSLTSSAVGDTAKPRLDTLKLTAAKLLDAMTASDKVALITASRPSAAVVAPATSDPAMVRRHIQTLTPTASAADIAGALRLALKAIEEADDPSRPTYVALLSDFSAGAVPTEGAAATLPPELAALGERARLLMAAPAEAQANVQIASLEPDRRVVVADVAGATPTVAWTLKLRRYAEALGGDELSTVRIHVPGATPIRQTVRWKPGQAESEVRLTTPLGQGETSNRGASTGLLAVEAVMEPGAVGTDALTADNTRHALVRLRQKLVVMLVDRRQEQQAKEYTPGRWLTTVLAPVADRLGWPIEVRQHDAGAIDAGALRDVDAMLVLRGDLVDDGGWGAIKRWTESGGLAWFMPPPHDTPSIWPQKMADAFGLPWSVTLEPVEHKPPLRLAVDVPATAELARLRADLVDLLRPIEVARRLPVDAASLGGDTDVMLRGQGGEPIFIGAAPASGDGRVLLLAGAIDAAWNNIATKPLFVPLIHESLRAAIDRLQPARHFEPGDQPTLGGAFRGANRLIGPDGKDVLLIKQQPPAAREPGKQPRAQAAPSVAPIRPLMDTGVYRTETDALVVEVDAAAANTLTADPAALRAYLAPLGTWLTLDAADPASAMHGPSLAAHWGWHLLWAVLALALVETFLARYVSHAHAQQRTASVMMTATRTAA